ncbi:3'-5' exonuclease [Lysobacter korlensis]|uniref:3'-5' exonuclease n=1 Tax=Lysobacter korlensis TaxID=553636 RepID=A0ABV6S155_9GAMM
MARRWYEELAVFDLETTGVDVESCRIVSAHVGILDAAGELKEQWDWLADPGVEIPDGAAAVHGITTERARAEGRPAAEVVGEIVATLDAILFSGMPLVVYNAPYDLTLLDREALRHGVLPVHDPSPVIDPLVIDKALDKYRRGKRTLTVASEVYGVELTDAHTAGADAVAAGRVAQAIARAYEGTLAVNVHELHALQIGWSSAQAASFEEYMRRTVDPAFTAVGEWPMRALPVLPKTRKGRPAEADRPVRAKAAKPVLEVEAAGVGV